MTMGYGPHGALSNSTSQPASQPTAAEPPGRSQDFHISIAGDSRSIYVLDRTCLLRTWDSTTGRLLHDPERIELGAKDCVRAISPDGRTLAVQHGERYGPADEIRMDIFSRPSGSIRGLIPAGVDAAFSADGSRVAVATTSGEIYVLDTEHGEQLCRFPLRAQASGLRLDSNGSTVAMLIAMRTATPGATRKELALLDVSSG